MPTLNAARHLRDAVNACAGVREVVVVDGGSKDDTPEIAKAIGARLVRSPAGRGVQMHAGATQSAGEWLLFLHADTVLTGAWKDETANFVADPANRERAAAFTFGLDDQSPEARSLERRVAWRTTHLALPYGDQGLLIHRDFYSAFGGFKAWPIMEDVDLVRRIGRHRLTVFASVARTSAERWRREGWHRRSIRNLTCLSLYFLGVPPRLIAKLYG